MSSDISTNPFADDRLREECGIFGIWGKPEAAAFVVLGLHALQHRGQEASGIVSFDGERFYMERREGLVGDQFSVGGPIDRIKGANAIGHVRYSTTGGSLNRNIQPFFADVADGGIAVAHNGNLTNAHALRKRLVRSGSIFYSTSDTECIVHLIATSSAGRIVDRLIDALKQVEGAYSLVCLTRKKLIGVRDPLGVRPLVIGQLEGAYVLASETCALDIIGAEFVRDVKPGEMVVISDSGMESYQPFPPQRPRFCIFEYVYFARPDSMIDGMGVYEVRKSIGSELALEAPVEADMVVPVPDSGVPAGIGYAETSKIPFELGIIRNHYVGRTFIEPSDHIRHLGVKLKHNANRARLKGKRVVLWMTPLCGVRRPRKSSKWSVMPGRPKCTCVSPVRRQRIHAFTASIRRKNRTCLRRTTPSLKCAASSARTRSASSRSTASIVPCTKHGATGRRHAIAMPASPASTQRL